MTGRAEPPSALRSPVIVGALTRCWFPPAGTAVTCAVSGGADSMALMVLAVATRCRVTAVHVDHGLRAGSGAEADVVAAAAATLGAGFRAERVDLAPGPNLQARARRARSEALPADALTGHTADDRAETVLLNLIRGAGPTGAAGMARSPRRPLIDLRRRDTETVCAEAGLVPVQDPSNADRRYRRNRVRHELLPLLADIAERDVVEVLVRQADLFAELDAVIAATAAALDPTSARDLATAPRPLAGAAVRAWLADAGVGAGYPVDVAAVDRVLAVARGERVACEVVGGWRVSRTAGRLAVTVANPVSPAPGRMADHG